MQEKAPARYGGATTRLLGAAVIVAPLAVALLLFGREELFFTRADCLGDPFEARR